MPRRALALALVILLAGCAAGPSKAPDGDARAWTLVDTDGVTRASDDPANATVLFFMATWCSSCRTKAPMLAQVQDDHPEVRFLSVDFDPTETPADIAAWKEKYSQDWPHGIDAGRAVQRALDITVQSSVVVLDRDGRVVARWGYGQVTEDALRAALAGALAAPA